MRAELTIALEIRAVTIPWQYIYDARALSREKDSKLRGKNCEVSDYELLLRVFSAPFGQDSRRRVQGNRERIQLRMFEAVQRGSLTFRSARVRIYNVRSLIFICLFYLLLHIHF